MCTHNTCEDFGLLGSKMNYQRRWHTSGHFSRAFPLQNLWLKRQNLNQVAIVNGQMGCKLWNSTHGAQYIKDEMLLSWSYWEMENKYLVLNRTTIFFKTSPTTVVIWSFLDIFLFILRSRIFMWSAGEIGEPITKI